MLESVFSVRQTRKLHLFRPIGPMTPKANVYRALTLLRMTVRAPEKL